MTGTYGETAPEDRGQSDGEMEGDDHLSNELMDGKLNT